MTYRSLRSFLTLCLLSACAFHPVHAEEYVKSKSYANPPEQVFAAAQRVVQKIDAKILELDKDKHLVRFQTVGPSRQWINESPSAQYAIFAVVTDSPQKSIATLRVGQIGNVAATPPNLKPTHVLESAFARKFYKLLAIELKH